MGSSILDKLRPGKTLSTFHLTELDFDVEEKLRAFEHQVEISSRAVESSREQSRVVESNREQPRAVESSRE